MGFREQEAFLFTGLQGVYVYMSIYIYRFSKVLQQECLAGNNRSCGGLKVKRLDQVSKIL